MAEVAPRTDAASAAVVDSVSTNGSVSKPSLMVSLAGTISKETAIVDQYFREQGGAQPGFDEDCLLDFLNLPDEVQRARSEVLRATAELRDLVTGPTESLRWMAWNVHTTTLFECENIQLMIDPHAVQRPNVIKCSRPLQHR